MKISPWDVCAGTFRWLLSLFPKEERRESPPGALTTSGAFCCHDELGWARPKWGGMGYFGFRGWDGVFWVSRWETHSMGCLTPYWEQLERRDVDLGLFL